MPKNISRRAFLATGSAALTLGATMRSFAIEPFQRSGGGRLRMSLAAYSFRDYFKDGERPGKKAESGKEMDMFRFIDYCGEHGCAGAEVTSYYFPKNVTSEYLLRLKRHAFVAGVEISGTAVGNTFTVPAGEAREKQVKGVKDWIDRAALVGAPHIRVFAGDAQGQPLEVARRNCIEALSECAAYAGEKGVFLGVENHGGIVADPDGLLAIIHAVQSPWVGVNLDSGNFRTADPYEDFARCAPYAVNVQIKTEVTPRGQKTRPADLTRFTDILRQAHYQGYVALEYEAAEDPYTAVPVALAELKRLCDPS